jgi:hypothetical protein
VAQTERPLRSVGILIGIITIAGTPPPPPGSAATDHAWAG